MEEFTHKRSGKMNSASSIPECSPIDLKKGERGSLSLINITHTWMMLSSLKEAYAMTKV
jgi:hypothetical protein